MMARPAMGGAAPGLAYDDTPPFSAPLRFFLTAPLFAIAAGAVLLFGGDILVSRWTPGALAIVHLFAAGFMLQVMLGALVQVMPVVAGASMPAPLRTAGTTHILMTLGTASLAYGLGAGHPDILLAGAGMLLLGLATFLGAAIVGLRKGSTTGTNTRTPRDLRLAFFGLAVTATLGLLLSLTLGRGLELPLPLPTMVNLHAGWGWMGWAAVLLAATSWVVVPMFQITAPYPQRFTTFWAPAVTALLLVWSASAFFSGADWPGIAAVIALALLGAGYAGMTLRLQAGSRRSKLDTPFLAFRQAMHAALAGIVVLLLALWTDADYWPVLAGILVLHGGFGGAITAMLYKIVPFLAWLHLTQSGVKAPNMKKLLPDVHIRRQLKVRTLSLGALCIAVFVPFLAPLAGALLMVEFGWLLLNLVRVVRARRTALLAAPTRAESRAGG